MDAKSAAFQETFDYYLAQISNIDLGSITETLGVRVEGHEVTIPFFNQTYRVSRKGIVNTTGKQPFIGISVVLFKYLLMCPKIASLDKEWVSYKDFKDSAPLSGSFVANTERPIAEYFSGRLDDLAAACQRLGGRDPGLDLPYQLVVKLHILPKVPVLILFDDADEEFPAQCKVLFERRADLYLDAECLAIVGMLLAEHLKKN